MVDNITYFICDKCNGNGVIKKPYVKFKRLQGFQSGPIQVNSIAVCQKCHGTGELDWIENIVGKKPPGINIKIEKKPIAPKDRKIK